MQAARTATERALISGSLASLASTAALVALAHAEGRRPAAPVNAISHWLHGDESFRHDAPRLRYTLPGYAIHHLMSLGWSLSFEALRLWQPRRSSALADAAAVASIACAVDYTITPPRLRPGFEHKLSIPSLAVVYAAFAGGLALAALSRR
jgi:hypothetical protein